MPNVYCRKCGTKPDSGVEFKTSKRCLPCQKTSRSETYYRQIGKEKPPPQCRKCGTTPDTGAVFTTSKRCLACYTAIRSRKPKPKASPADRAAGVRKRNLKLFGMTPAQYDDLLALQGGHCALCPAKDSNGRRLAVDHDWKTGKVRGLLCSLHNRGLGCFGDDPTELERAVAYLRQTPPVDYTASPKTQRPWKPRKQAQIGEAPE